MAETPRTPTAIECRFVTFCPSRDSEPDLHVVKEVRHYPDGTTEPALRFIENYERSFGITKKGQRNHKDFKEWENKDALDFYKTRQSDLVFNIARALGKPNFRGGLKDLCQSPYIYGADITSTSIIKHNYQAKWPVITPYSNAVFDTETDVVKGTGQIQMATISFKKKVFTAVQKSFVSGWSNPIERIKELAEQYLAEVLKTREIELIIVIVDSEIDVVKQVIAKAHEWRPDFLSVWNLEFDINKVVEACERAGVDIADLMSDPSVPKQYRQFKMKLGMAKKVTASGRILNFKPSQRWHSITAPSSFFWMDAMCAYRQVRTGAPEEPSYALDAMLKKHLNITKLKFPDLEAAGVPAEGGLEWHKVMQEKFPLHYVVYNIFDCVSMEMLDEKIKDLQLSLPMFAGCTDFANFNSLPRKTMNELHWFCDTRGKVPGSTASEMATDMDEETTSVTGWIVMLPSHLVADNGLRLIKENPDLRTNIRTHVADLDVAGAYPHNELVFNVSKETTAKELISIEGFDDLTVRMQTINFSAGKTNALEFCQTLYGMPQLTDLLQHYDNSKFEHATSIDGIIANVQQGVPQ